MDDTVAAAQAQATSSGRNGSDAGAWRALSRRIALYLAATLFIVVARPGPVVAMVLIGFATVYTIVTDARFGWERWLERRGIPSREAWAPALMMVVLVAGGWVDGNAIAGGIGKLDIIAFILAFAILAEGLGRSGFFNYMAYQFTERCHGNTSRLIIYLFLLSSLATYITSNDIVILILTPIVLSVATSAGLRNAKLLLLSQFVAANTVSMGLLIGSPTNLIIGEQLGLNFFSYAFLMAIPTVIALMATLIIIDWINRSVSTIDDSDPSTTAAHGWWHRLHLPRLLGARRSWAYQPTYRTPRFTDHTEFTPAMRRWVWILIGSVVLVIIVTFVGWALYWAAAPIALLTITAFAIETPAPVGERAARRATEVGAALRRLPYGIVFFGTAFFVLAAAIGEQDFVKNDVATTVSDMFSNTPLLGGIAGVLGSGILTNMLNDLPASALIGGILEGITGGDGVAPFATPFATALATQVSLIGVNLGTYVTPIGALAGIIWFDRLRQANVAPTPPGMTPGGTTTEVSEPMEVPDRGDLIFYGAGIFLVLALVMGLTSFTVLSVADWLLGPTNGPSVVAGSPVRVITTLFGLVLIAGIVMALRRQLRRNGVLLVHMVDVFMFANRFRYWVARHRLGWAFIVTGLGLMIAAGSLYWVEVFHANAYGLPSPFDGVGDFISWFTVIVSSGFENSDGPRSILGVVLAGALALGAIAAILYLIRASTQGGTASFRLRVARGEIPAKRLVIVNASDDEINLVSSVLATRGSRFVVAVGASSGADRLRATLERDEVDRAAFILPDTSPTETVAALDLASAREIVLLSRSSSDDFANTALISALDEELGRRSVATTGVEENHLGVLFQAFMSETQDLLATRVSAELLSRTAIISVGHEFTEFVAAHTSGDPNRLSSFFAPAFPASGSTTRSLNVSGSLAPLSEVDLPDHTLTAVNELLARSAEADPTGLDTRHSWGLRASLDDVIVSGLTSATATNPPDNCDGATGTPLLVGVVVEDSNHRDHLTLADLSESSAPRSVAGAIVLHDGAASAPSPSPTTDTPTTVLIGSSDPLIACARRLARDGRPVVVIHPQQDRTAVQLASVDGVHLRGVERVQDAVALVREFGTARHRLAVFDTDATSPWQVEKLLELLSLDRMRMIRDGRVPPPLMVQCTGRGRREFLSRFVVDEVVDSTWIAQSYFQILIAAYFGALRGGPTDDDGDSESSAANRFVAAHHAALALMRFEALPAHLVVLQVPREGPRDVTTMHYAAALTASRRALGVSGPIIGGARFTQTQLTNGGVALTLRLIRSNDDTQIEPDDVLLLIPHL